MEKLISKGKHTVKGGNNLHTNMISKPKNCEKKKAQLLDTGNAFEITRPET